LSNRGTSSEDDDFDGLFDENYFIYTLRGNPDAGAEMLRTPDLRPGMRVELGCGHGCIGNALAQKALG
jgi:hypothetical protein